MKSDTKKLLIGGGAVAAIAYFLFKPSGDAAGLGGGGGIPLLSAPFEEAAEAAGESVGSVVYNFPVIPGPQWDTEEAAAGETPVTKKMAYAPTLLPSFPLEYYMRGGVSELSAAAVPAQKLKSVMELQPYGDPLAYLFSGRTDRIESKKIQQLKPDIHKILSVKGHEAATKKFDVSKYGKKSKKGGGGTYPRGSMSGSLARVGNVARSTALSSVKKSQKRAGSPD